MQTQAYRGYSIHSAPNLIFAFVTKDGRIVCSASSVTTCKLMIDAIAPRMVA